MERIGHQCQKQIPGSLEESMPSKEKRRIRSDQSYYPKCWAAS
uniref:Uncharacterized protein n=1 Tax=Arundo donax TaxID=35708 RepID=A0A0A9FIG1_ARUDO